jgi:hypothetical protein
MQFGFAVYAQIPFVDGEVEVIGVGVYGLKAVEIAQPFVLATNDQYWVFLHQNVAPCAKRPGMPLTLSLRYMNHFQVNHS